MEVRIASQPSPDHVVNEDYAFAVPGLAGVLDGASVPPGLETGCVHGPSWYVRRLAVHLAHAHVKNPEAPLTHGLVEAIMAVREEHGGRCDLDHPGTPTSTVCLLKDLGGDVEYLVLCDSPIVLDYGTRIDVITDERFAAAVAGLRHAALTGQTAIGSGDHAARVRQVVTEQRRLINTRNGYWIAAADPHAAHHAVTGIVPIGGHNGVRRAALLTDGAACAVSPFGLMGWPDLLNIMTTHGPQELINRVRGAERADADGRRQPRYKSHDDATAALCLFEQDQSP